MSKVRFVLALIVSVLTFAPMGAWSVPPAGGMRYKPNELIVRYKHGVRRDAPFMENLYSSSGVVRVKRFHSRFRDFEHLILAPGTDLGRAARNLQSNSAVAYVQPNYILYIQPVLNRNEAAAYGWRHLPANRFPVPRLEEGERPAIAPKPAEVNPPVADPDLDQSYGISKIGAKKAWTASRGSQHIVVGVIDTGVDYNHQDLSFNMWRNPDPNAKDIVGWDFIHNDNLPFDDHNHGSHCSGVIGAVGGNGVGISGVNQRVSIMALKFLSAEGSGETVDAVKAIDYAIGHGANVLSNSWGGGADEDNKMLEEAILRADKAGILFVAAAGNNSGDNDTDPMYPAGFQTPNMIAVAATDAQDRRAFFSNYGVKTVHLGAPGVNVYSTVAGNRYAKMSGTSMACPHVAGAAALLWSTNPRLSHKEVKAALLAGVDRIPAMEGKTITGGRLNIARSMGAMLQHLRARGF
ncbi:MAG: S8 family serine peptidase [Deltaproteobacteria bacterium]|nr:S8 family serine peptidase [Deltaproteobacteria bacterium]